MLATALAGPAAACAPGGGSEDATADASVDDAPSARVAPETEFTSLFDGASLDAWRGYRRDDVPGGWGLEDGTLAFDPTGEGGDLVTRDQFDNFELRLEWKVSEGGNSGIFFHVIERFDWPWMSGPEMQVLDNDRHVDGQDPLTSAGSNYALHGPVNDVTRPVGEWNEVRLIVDGIHVEHWLNGERVVAYTLWTPEWVDAVQASKFAEMPDYGLSRSGHIALQDHGDRVCFRDIRIRPIGDGQ